MSRLERRLRTLEQREADPEQPVARRQAAPEFEAPAGSHLPPSAAAAAATRPGPVTPPAPGPAPEPATGIDVAGPQGSFVPPPVPPSAPDAGETDTSAGSPGSGRSPATVATRTPFLDEPGPGLLARMLDGGNWLVRGGVLVLFLGVGFLLKFAADNALLPVPLRLAGVALGGLALVVAGARLLHRRRAYALALEGGGVGLLYLTLYAAFRLYGILPAGVAFALMGVVVVKLMLVDLASSGTIARIVSFITVGLLLMLVGYLAPVPPRQDEAVTDVTSPSST